MKQLDLWVRTCSHCRIVLTEENTPKASKHWCVECYRAYHRRWMQRNGKRVAEMTNDERWWQVIRKRPGLRHWKGRFGEWWAQWRGQCQLCGWRLHHWQWDLHRKIPGKSGGEYVDGNVVPVCRECNQLAGAIPYDLAVAACQRAKGVPPMLELVPFFVDADPPEGQRAAGLYSMYLHGRWSGYKHI